MIYVYMSLCPISQLFFTVCSLRNYHSSQKEALQTRTRTANPNLILIFTNLQRVRMFQKLQPFFQARSPRIILVTISLRNERVVCARHKRDHHPRWLGGNVCWSATEDRNRVTASLAPRFSGRRHRSLPWRDVSSPSSLHCQSITGPQTFYLNPDTFRRWKSSCDTAMYYRMIISILSDKSEINSFPQYFRECKDDPHRSVTFPALSNDSFKHLSMYTRVYTRIICLLFIRVHVLKY